MGEAKRRKQNEKRLVEQTLEMDKETISFTSCLGKVILANELALPDKEFNKRCHQPLECYTSEFILHYEKALKGVYFVDLMSEGDMHTSAMFCHEDEELNNLRNSNKQTQMLDEITEACLLAFGLRKPKGLPLFKKRVTHFSFTKEILYSSSFDDLPAYDVLWDGANHTQ